MSLLLFPELENEPAPKPPQPQPPPSFWTWLQKLYHKLFPYG